MFGKLVKSVYAAMFFLLANASALTPYGTRVSPARLLRATGGYGARTNPERRLLDTPDADHDRSMAARLHTIRRLPRQYA